MSQDIIYDVNDEKDDMKYSYEASNSTQNLCPHDYESSTILIQHLSEDIGYSIVTNAACKQNEILYEAVIPFQSFKNVQTSILSK